ncbi:MAG: bacillithiol biosynthesis deacetylase BshB1 [Bacteroidota bacterium]|jgi:bacillithiol biosynthesis deacetylase BshB1
MKLDILAFAAHPDDVELSCAGTIMKHIDQGKKVGIIDLTEGELGSRGTAETRREEAKAASEIMGLHRRDNLRMRDGFFELSESNKRLIIEQIRKYRPEIVLANAMSDRHPDHGRAGKLVSEACYLAGLRKIETIHEGVVQEAHRPRAVYHYIQDYYMAPDFVVDVTGYVDRKIEAIKVYKTQFYDPESIEPQTPISGAEFIEFLKGRMIQNGRIAKTEYAEAYTVERAPGVNDLFDLL